MCSENARTLAKEIEEDTKKWKKFHAHGLEDIVKVSTIPKKSTHLLQSLSKSCQHFSQTRTNNPEICVKPHKSPSSQSNPEKEKKSWRYHESGYIAKLLSSRQYGTAQKTDT